MLWFFAFAGIEDALGGGRVSAVQVVPEFASMECFSTASFGSGVIIPFLIAIYVTCSGSSRVS